VTRRPSFMNWCQGVRERGGHRPVMHVRQMAWPGAGVAGTTLRRLPPPPAHPPPQSQSLALPVPVPATGHASAVTWSRKAKLPVRLLNPWLNPELSTPGCRATRSSSCGLPPPSGGSRVLRGATALAWRGMAPGSRKDRASSGYPRRPVTAMSCASPPSTPSVAIPFIQSTAAFPPLARQAGASVASARCSRKAYPSIAAL